MAPIHKTAATASDRKLIVLSCCCDIVRINIYFSASLLCIYSGSNNYVCFGVDMVSLSNNVELLMMFVLDGSEMMWRVIIAIGNQEQCGRRVSGGDE